MIIKETEWNRLFPRIEDQEMVKNMAKSGTFERLSVEFNQIEHSYTVNALFRARYYKYKIMLEIDFYGEVTSMKCDCSLSYNQDCCVHIGAVVLRLMEIPEGTRLPYFETHNPNAEAIFLQNQLRVENERKRHTQLLKQRSLALVEKYQRAFNQETMMALEVEKIQIKPTLEIVYDYLKHPQLMVAFKLGIEKLYIIKDLPQFLRRIKNKEKISYGKSLELVHDESNFDEDSKKIISFIRKYVPDEVNYRNSPFHSSKLIPLNETNLDEFYDCMSDLQESSLLLKEDPMEIFLTADVVSNEEETLYSIMLESVCSMPFFGQHHIYELQSDTLIRRTLDEGGKGLNLLKCFEEQNELLFTREQIKNFYKYILSDLEDIVVIEGLDEELIPQEETRICLYGDIDDHGDICLTLVCHYGEVKRYGFDQEEAFQSLRLERIKKCLLNYAERIDQDLHQVYFQAGSEKAIQFSQEALPMLQQYAEIFVSDALKNLGNTKKIDLKVGISVEHDLLQIDVDSVDLDREEIFELLKAYRRKKRFHRLNNGQLFSLQSKELEELDQVFEQWGVMQSQLTGASLQLPAYRAFVAEQAQTSFRQIQFLRKKPFDQFIQRFKEKKSTLPELPHKLESILRDYQKVGVNWLMKISDYGFGGILADDMGLGKTLQMITFLETMKSADRTSLVVCPSSLLLNWQDEIRKFSSELKSLCILGNSTARKMLIERAQEADIVITSYDYLRRDLGLLENIDFYCVILDEAQYIKNQKTKNALSVKRLKAKHRFALTGTPIENSLAELWSIFDFLMPNYLYSYHYFQNHYEKAIVKERDESKQVQLKKMVEPFILRRNKKEVLTELPDKIENTYTMNFEEEERKLYLANLAQVNHELQAKMKMEQLDRIAVLAMLTRLRQICCEPRMIYENIHHASSKLKGCMELIQALNLSQRQILLFSSFTTALDLIAQELDKEGISYLMLTGKTEKEERRKRVIQFQNQEASVFLISLKAGGTGLNLTAAEAVIHYDPWWNISAQNQATDRAYRMGQERNVQVFKLIMKDSIEEKILEMQEKKKNLADAFVEDSEGSISRMNLDEIVDLLKI